VHARYVIVQDANESHQHAVQRLSKVIQAGISIVSDAPALDAAGESVGESGAPPQARPAAKPLTSSSFKEFADYDDVAGDEPPPEAAPHTRNGRGANTKEVHVTRARQARPLSACATH
jgi:hypothetical protein